MKVSDEMRFPHPVLSPATQDFADGEFNFSFGVEERTSDGKLKPCLMRSDNLVDLLGPMRRGCSDAYLEKLFLKAVSLRSPYYRAG